MVFTFGGYLTSYPSLQLAILETATWLPLALYFLDRATERGTDPELGTRGARVDPTGANFVCAGIVLGVAALAGHPQTFSFVLATTVLYFAYRLWEKRRTAPERNRGLILSFLVSLLIALGISAAQWIPSIEYQQLSTREALSFSQAATGFTTPNLLQFIFPGYTSAFASPLYVGILPLWLACFALMRPGRQRVFWGLVALGALIFSLGFNVFAYTLIYLLPGGGLFRDQERIALIISFSLALLSGFGLTQLQAITSTLSTKARKLFLLLPAGAAISFVLLITFFIAGEQQASDRLNFLLDRGLDASPLRLGECNCWCLPRTSHLAVSPYASCVHTDPF